MSIRVLDFEGLEKGVRVVMERAQRGEVKVCAVTAERLCTMEHWPLSALVYDAIANRALRKVCKIGFEVGLSSRKGLWYGTIRLCAFTATGKFRVSQSRSLILRSCD
jgi:hypothetical protein